MSSNSLYQTLCHQPLLDLKDFSKLVVIGLLSHSQDSRPFSGSFLGSFSRVKNLPFLVLFMSEEPSSDVFPGLFI